MQETGVPLKSPRIPENTFFLEPQSYWQWKGELGFSDSPEYRAYIKGSKVALALAVIFLLPLLLVQTLVAFIFFGGLSLLSAGTAIWLFKNAPPHDQYQAFGTVIIGELVSIQKEYFPAPTPDRPSPRPYRGGHYTVGEYRFKNPAGQILLGNFRVWRTITDYEKYTDKAEPGSPVVVLYITPTRFQVC